MSHVSIRLNRLAEQSYEAVNSRGATMRFGAEEGFTPVELLLAAIAGCSSIDVDVVTSRHSTPEVFEVTAEADKVSDGGNRLENIRLTFDLRFPDDEGGDAARARINAALRASHNSGCTVSRTVELPTPVEFRVKD